MESASEVFHGVTPIQTNGEVNPFRGTDSYEDSKPKLDKVHLSYLKCDL